MFNRIATFRLLAVLFLVLLPATFTWADSEVTQT